MQRINTPTRWIDKFGPGRDGFRPGDPATGIPSTQLEAPWFDHAQEEIARAIELSGGVLNPADYEQLYAAIQRIAAGVSGAYVLKAGDTMTGNLTAPNIRTNDLDALIVTATSGTFAVAPGTAMGRGVDAVWRWIDNFNDLMTLTPTGDLTVLRNFYGTGNGEFRGTVLFAVADTAEFRAGWDPALQSCTLAWGVNNSDSWRPADQRRVWILNGASRMELDNGGNLVITGNFGAGNFPLTIFADELEKAPLSELADYTNGLDEILAAQPKIYHTPGQMRPQVNIIGAGREDLQTLATVPECVFALVNAFKELYARLAALEERR